MVFPYKKNSLLIIRQYKSLNPSLLNKIKAFIDINIDVYKGKNKHVLNMMSYLEKYLKDDLVGAYVHRSLGTYEKLFYSDFAKLAILKKDIPLLLLYKNIYFSHNL